MKFGLIAERVGHSFSAELHRLIGEYSYELQEVAPDELPSFMKAQNFLGINVTIPYKKTVIPFLDHISDTSKAIGAVNTIVRRNDELYGYNTDYGGMCALIRHMGLDFSGKKVLILGTGGTGKTARAVAKTLGAGEIVPVSRTAKNCAVTYDEAYKHHTDAEFLINTTPCGMFPDPDVTPIDLEPFKTLRGVVDVVYNPLSTRLVCDARERGIIAQGGLYMLVKQAVLSAELFTGHCLDAGLTDRIYRLILQEKQNIVLIGMPGCGKTSVGGKIAQVLHRTFVDLDQLIVSHAGKSIAGIFREDGESCFRTLETQAVRDISRQTGLVIATGGGCVLRRENVEMLRRNGLLFFLDRPLSGLFPTADRPLADSTEKIKALYTQRRPVYEDAADKRVPVSGYVTDTALTVIRLFQEVQNDEVGGSKRA